MIIIKFNDSSEEHKVSFSRTSNVVNLYGIEEKDDSGFKAFRLSGELLGDYSEFATVYDSGKGYVSYSNDGSVKTDPVQPEDSPEQIPTLEERVNDLEIAICEITDSMM